jgi:flagellar M-ring protein FliF
MLRLKTGYRMSPGNVAAVVHLVSGAVEGLRPQKVVVVDSQGNLLSGEADDELAKKAGTFLDYKTQYEEYLARKAEDMLTKVLGPNRASVRVDAQVETSSVVQTTETYDPEKRVVIKEEQKSSSSTPGETKGEGSGGAMKEENNTNEYMASKTVEQRTDMPGKVRSLTVAAFVDLSAPPPGPDGKPLPAPSLTAKDVEEIIRNAMGLKPTDTIKVVSTSFYNPPVEVAKDDGGQSTKDLILEIARRSSLGLLVIGALIAMKMVRGKKSKVTAAEAAAALPGSASAAGFLPAGEETVNMNLDSLRQRITQALQENPEEVKRLFASWVNSEQGGA